MTTPAQFWTFAKPLGSREGPDQASDGLVTIRLDQVAAYEADSSSPKTTTVVQMMSGAEIYIFCHVADFCHILYETEIMKQHHSFNENLEEFGS